MFFFSILVIKPLKHSYVFLFLKTMTIMVAVKERYLFLKEFKVASITLEFITIIILIKISAKWNSFSKFRARTSY